MVAQVLLAQLRLALLTRMVGKAKGNVSTYENHIVMSVATGISRNHFLEKLQMPCDGSLFPSTSYSAQQDTITVTTSTGERHVESVMVHTARSICLPPDLVPKLVQSRDVTGIALQGVKSRSGLSLRAGPPLRLRRALVSPSNFSVLTTLLRSVEWIFITSDSKGRGTHVQFPVGIGAR